MSNGNRSVFLHIWMILSLNKRKDAELCNDEATIVHLTIKCRETLSWKINSVLLLCLFSLRVYGSDHNKLMIFLLHLYWNSFNNDFLFLIFFVHCAILTAHIPKLSACVVITFCNFYTLQNILLWIQIFFKLSK